MTIGTNARNDYIGDGATATFDYGFKIFAASDLRVTVRDLDGLEEELGAPDDYSVTGVGNREGGTITLLAGNLAAGYSLSIRRVRPLTQTTDLRNQAGFFAEVHESTFDHVVMLVQQLADEAARSLRFGETDFSDGTIPGPEQRRGQMLAFHPDTGEPIVGNPVSSIVSPFWQSLLLRLDAPTVIEQLLSGHAEQVRDLIDMPHVLGVKQHFGAKGDGVTDDTAALQAARDYIAAVPGKKPRLIFEEGIYRYSVSPNWAIKDAVIAAQGEVRLRYTGTGTAVIIDAGETGGVYNVNFGWGNPFLIEATASAQDGCWMRAIHHGKIGIKVLGCGPTRAGLRVNFAVCTEFQVTVSVNEEGWYTAARPYHGIVLDKRANQENTSYCTFWNPVIEGVIGGIVCSSSTGNLFIGGTSEGNGESGVSTVAVSGFNGSYYDRFIGMDFEVNSVIDIYFNGTGNELINCDTTGNASIGSGAKHCKVLGGAHERILINAGAIGTTVRDVIYNRTSSGTFSDAGTDSTIVNARNAQTNALWGHGQTTTDLPSIAAGQSASVQISVPGARVGDFVDVAAALSSPLRLSGQVSAANVVTLSAFNPTAGAVDVGSATFKACIRRGT